MGTCEMCGTSTDNLRKMRVEGTELDLCPNCAKFGTTVEEKPMPRFVKGFNPRTREFTQTPERKEVVMIIIDDYARRIKQARERLGLNQEEFSKKLNEKQSIMQKIESGSFEPSIEQARKFEKILKINLIEEYSEGGETPISRAELSSEGLTLGDLIKQKMGK